MRQHYTKITEEVYTKTNEFIYIVYINNDLVSYFTNEESAKIAVSSYGNYELELLQNKTNLTKTKISVEHSEDGQNYVIKTQSLGYLMNGYSNVYMTIRFDKLFRSVTKEQVPPPLPPKPIYYAAGKTKIYNVYPSEYDIIDPADVIE